MGQVNVAKVRLDLLLVERGLAETRERAQALILAGEVTVAGQPATKAGQSYLADAPVEVRQGLPYVSRGGVKLAHALEAFAIVVADLVVADIGASTGGFTDCLLQRGARRVYAIDVGHNQLAWRLRNDPRVVVMEKTNVRHLTSLLEQPDAAVADVSFISLALALPPVLPLLAPNAWLVCLVKPQFEAGREQVGRGGVVRDPDVHRQVLRRMIAWSESAGLRPLGLVPSPLRGPAGNVEFLIHLGKQTANDQRPDGARPSGSAARFIDDKIDDMVEECLAAVER